MSPTKLPILLPSLSALNKRSSTKLNTRTLLILLLLLKLDIIESKIPGAPQRSVQIPSVRIQMAILAATVERKAALWKEKGTRYLPDTPRHEKHERKRTRRGTNLPLEELRPWV